MSVARCLLLLVLTASLLPADPVALTVSPNPAPKNLYRWQLLPGLLDQKPGGAVPAFKKAHAAFLATEPDRAVHNALLVEIDELRQKPLDPAQLQRIKEVVTKYRGPIDLVTAAARHEYADWGFITERLRKSGLAARLEEVHEVREFLNWLILDARLALLEDRPEEAVRIAASAFALARHIDGCPTVIAHLVSTACGMHGLTILEDCIRHPKCPSLYHSLGDLPRPFLTSRMGFEGDRLMCRGSIPGLARILEDPVGTELTGEVIDKLVRLYDGLLRDAPGSAPSRIVNRFTLGVSMKEKYPAAKEALRAAGYPDATIEKMPLMNASLLHALFQYEEALGRIAVASTLPYPQAQKMTDEVMKRFPKKAEPLPDDAAFPLRHLFLPGADRILLNDLRMQRRIDLLRAAEGLRLHAAGTGKWPETLAAVTVVPLPNDPATLAPFAYSLEGDVAILVAPLPRAGLDAKHATTLKLTLRPREEKKP